MKKSITIAVDAMGGENSPSKIIKGISLHQKNSKDIFYKIFGNKNLINTIIDSERLNKNTFETIHTEDKIEDEDSALSAAKKGKNTSMWLAIESVKQKKIRHSYIGWKYSCSSWDCKVKFKND